MYQTFLMTVFILFIFIRALKHVWPKARDTTDERVSRKCTAEELVPVAQDFIEPLQNTPTISGMEGYPTARCAVIGGVATISHCPYRTTWDIDFIIHSNPHYDFDTQRIKEAMVVAHPTRCKFFAYVFKFLADDGWVQVDLVPSLKTGYTPAAMQPIAGLVPSQLPIATVDDLITLKMESCGNRGNEEKNRTDGEDVWRLMREIRILPNSPLWRSLFLARHRLRESYSGRPWRAPVSHP
ncbi:hypothetical protein BJY04DRAFT_224400 [Aspergillus karnatakaensis]|uniref:uncharacterized protein n=1 Tax=Aspergillus karnatakaensis TaxID=1810916 RepID=UPI003CCDC5D2